MVALAAISISSAARGTASISVAKGRLRSRERSVISSLSKMQTEAYSSENRETAFAGIPFLADLVLDRQAARSGGGVPRVFLISRLWLVNVLDEVVDGGFLAHMAPLRGFRCFRHFDPPETLLVSFPGCYHSDRGSIFG